MTTRERMRQGKLYTDLVEGLEEERFRCRELVYEYNSSRPSEESRRQEILKELLGSVVTKDIPADVVAVGNPCRVLRPITERDKEFYYKDFKMADQ